jgi:outer membrane lipoprotein-sorting protein
MRDRSEKSEIRRVVASLVALGLAAAASLAQEGQPEPAKADATAKSTPAELAKKLEGVLDELSKRLGGVKSLRSRFEQKKYLEVFEEVVTSEGTMALAVPDKLRWEYLKPLKSVLLVNGRQAQRERTSRKGETTRKAYSLDDEPITAITAQQVFLWALGDFAKAREGYDLALASEKPLVVRATPKDDRVKNVVTSINLTFSDDRRMLTGVTLVEKSGAKTEISFLDVEINPTLADTLFKIDR